MGLVLLYLTLALALSFLCSILEAVLLSTPMSYISTKEKTHGKSAILLKKFKQDIDRPIAAILSLNTIAHTVGAAGVGAEAVKIFGEAYFGVISAILTILILVLSEIIPKTIGACYWRTLALPSARIINFHLLSPGVVVRADYPSVFFRQTRIIRKPRRGFGYDFHRGRRRCFPDERKQDDTKPH